MSIPTTTYENALIELRNQILTYSGLPNNFVLNGDSLYGPDVWKMITELIGESPDINDTFIIFEFKEIPNDAFGISIDNTDIKALAPYGLFIKIYGEHCHEAAYKLATIFRLPQVVEIVRKSGIKIMTSSLIGSLNEFINGIRWPRCDIEVDVLCNFNISVDNYDGDPYAESIALPINILKD